MVLTLNEFISYLNTIAGEGHGNQLLDGIDMIFGTNSRTYKMDTFYVSEIEKPTRKIPVKYHLRFLEQVPTDV